MAPIPSFGWYDDGPPAINAANLEQMLQDAGAYTDAETLRAETEEGILSAQITTISGTVTTISGGVVANTQAINAEIVRANGVEGGLASGLITVSGVLTTVSGSLAGEVIRAIGAEGALSSCITAVSGSLTTLSGAVTLLAPIANPAFTGIPTAPTPASVTDNNQIATTAFVQAVASGVQVTVSGAYIPLSQKAIASGVATLDGTAHVPITQIPAPNTGGHYETSFGDGVSSTFTINHNLNTLTPAVTVVNNFTSIEEGCAIDFLNANVISLSATAWTASPPSVSNYRVSIDASSGLVSSQGSVITGYAPLSLIGTASGIAPLDGSGLLPANRLPVTAATLISGVLNTAELPSSVVTTSSLAGGTLNASLAELGVGGFAVSTANPFGVNAVFTSASASGALFVGNQLNTTINGSGWAGVSTSNFFFGMNQYTQTGSSVGDGNGIASVASLLSEFDVTSPATTPPSASPFNSRFNIQFVTGLQAQAAFEGAAATSTVYQMTSLRVSAPTYKNGALSTRAIVDGVITGTTTLTSATAAFTSGDTGTTVVGTGIPYGTTITYVNATTATLSQACTNATGLSIAIGPGGSVLGPVYSLYIEPVQGTQVGSTNTFALFAAAGNAYIGGPLSLDLTQMSNIGYNPGQMGTRTGVIGGTPAINIKMPASFTARVIDAWDASGTFQVFAVTNSGAIQTAGTVLANQSATGQTKIGAVGTASAAGIGFGTSSGIDSIIQRVSSGIVSHPGPMFIVSSTVPAQLSGSGGLWVNTSDGTLHYINPSGTDSGLLPLSGGTMTGALAMGTNKITGLANGSASTDAAAFGQINPVVENVNTVASSGSGTVAIPDVTTDTMSSITLTGTPTFTFPTAAAGKSFSMELIQDATGSRTVTWPTIKWPGGVTPTLTATPAKRDVFTFACFDGTNWDGFTAGQNL